MSEIETIDMQVLGDPWVKQVVTKVRGDKDKLPTLPESVDDGKEARA